MRREQSSPDKAKKPSLVSALAHNQRVGVFVDAQNMYHSAKNLYKAKVNFKNVLDQAIRGRQLVRAFIYVVRTETGEEKAFLEALEKGGFELKEKDLQIFAGGMKKGDWDVGMAIDAVILAEKIDVAVLVTGDGDFLPLVEYLRISQGLKVEVMSFGRSTSGKLKEFADDFVDLGEDLGKYLIRTRSPKK
ncbi:MAG: NYN domain-containing protein [bacterium]|nr:NYN domain-containing protein [bacterium]